MKFVCLLFLALPFAALLPQPAIAAPMPNPNASCELDVSSILFMRDRLERDVSVAMLDAASASAILARPTLQHSELIAPDDALSSGPMPAGMKQEKGVIRFNSASGRQWCFADYEVLDLPGMDGDSRRFAYLGRFGKTSYLRIDVDFMHDSPYANLIDPRSGNMLSVHVGNDKGAMAPDGKRFLLVKDNDVSAFAVAAPAADGPRIDLACAMPKLRYGDPRALSVDIKGWENAETFALVVRPKAAKSAAAPVALRIRYEGNNWRLSASNPKVIDDAGGFHCSENLTLPAAGAACSTGCDKVALKTIAPALDLYPPLANMFQLALRNGGEGEEAALAAARRTIEAYCANCEIRKHGDRKRARRLNDQGIARLRDGKPDDAVIELLAAHASDPVDVEILNNLGYAEMLAGKAESGLHLVSALLLEPGRANAWANLGHLFARRGAVSEATACFALSLRFSAQPAKTLQFLKDVAAKDASPDLDLAIQRLVSQSWIDRLTGAAANINGAKPKQTP